MREGGRGRRKKDVDFFTLSFSFPFIQPAIFFNCKMTVTLESLKTLKVAELREELDRRGLDSTGLKAALLARLEEALAADASAAAGNGDASAPAEAVVAAAPAAAAAAPPAAAPPAPAAAAPIAAQAAPVSAPAAAEKVRSKEGRELRENVRTDNDVNQSMMLGLLFFSLDVDVVSCCLSQTPPSKGTINPAPLAISNSRTVITKSVGRPINFSLSEKLAGVLAIQTEKSLNPKSLIIFNCVFDLGENSTAFAP